MAKKMQPNLRSNNKYAEARAWAYDLILNSTGGTASSEISEMMAEQFKLPKKNMQHTLNQMRQVGILKATGKVVRNGKQVFVLVANRRRPNGAALPQVEPTPEVLPPATNGNGVYVVVETPEGPVKLSIAQARFFADKLSGFLK
jgi:hypothetical protein